MEVPLPQLCQVFVAILLSSTPFKIPRRTICWSTSPTVFAFVFSTGLFKNHQLSKISSPGKHCRSIIGSRDTSQGRWEWSVAVVWLPDFVARLVRQVRLIPSALCAEVCTNVVCPCCALAKAMSWLRHWWSTSIKYSLIWQHGTRRCP